MWPFRRKVKKRRLGVRQNIPSGGLTEAWRRFVRAGGVPGLMLAGAFFIGAVLMDAWPIYPLPYRQGQYLRRDVVSRVDFVESQTVVEAAVAEAHDSAPARFSLNESFVGRVVGSLRDLPSDLKAATGPTASQPIKEQFDLSRDEDVRAWLVYAEEDRLKDFQAQIERFRSVLLQTCIVPAEQLDWQMDRKAIDVTLTRDDGRMRIRIDEMIAVGDGRRIGEKIDQLAKLFDPALQASVRPYLHKTLDGGEPTYLYDPAGTAQSIAEAVGQVRANPPGGHKAGQVLVRRDRSGDGDESNGLTAEELRLLRKEHGVFLAEQSSRAGWLTYLAVAQRAGLLLVVTVVLCIYVAHYQPEIARNYWRGIALVALLLVMLAVSKAMHGPLDLNPNATMLTVLMTAAVVAIAYDQRFALAMGAVMALLVVLELRAPLAMLIALLAGVAAMVFQLQEIRTPTRLIRVAAVTGAIVFGVVWLRGLHEVPWVFLLTDGLWAGGFALLVGFLVLGFLPLIERVFRIATSATLLQWCDASKPLLKRLAMEAPGTYNHSLQLGSMCEAAAEAIGANGLLARVGAYYHDIGKINKPLYFAENEAGSASRHERISPGLSLLIIIGHVKDGLEMAHEYGLPGILHEFVATHHGTTLVQYFYHQAAQRSKDEGGEPPEEVEFRYPGPKPRLKEAAILMLADAAESSLRSVPEPTPGRIETQVHTMVNRRLMDGQLDHCELTLSEVHQIEASLAKSLCSIYHARVAYPEPPEPKAGNKHKREGAEGETPDTGPVEGTAPARSIESR